MAASGVDTVYGGQDNDILYGEGDNDRLSGDLGTDSLWGGDGADHFALTVGGGLDWVGDFSFGIGDRIELAAGTSYTVVDLSGQAGVQISGATMGLAGVAYASFSSSWIVFV